MIFCLSRYVLLCVYFILEALLVMITAVYMLACVGFFDDDTDTE